MSDDISSKVKKIVADHLGIDEAKVTDDSSFIDVSLANTNLERTKISIKSFGTNNFNCKNNSICN